MLPIPLVAILMLFVALLAGFVGYKIGYRRGVNVLDRYLAHVQNSEHSEE
jgi:membrane protein DedA with SNARE-associated domain